MRVKRCVQGEVGKGDAVPEEEPVVGEVFGQQRENVEELLPDRGASGVGDAEIGEDTREICPCLLARFV